MTIFRRLVVLLGDWAPQEGAFALAANWACRLRLPIHGVFLQGPELASKGQAFQETRIREVEKLCGDFCARVNVAWEVSRWQEPLAAELRRHIQPGDLLVCGRGLSPGLKNDLFREAKSGRVPALLLCPQAYHPLTRILLMDEGGPEHEELFTITVDLCRPFRAGLVVLTVARTEEEARLRQGRAREALRGSDLMTEFDFLVGPEVRGVAASVATWRRCQLVVMPPLEGPRWWRWWRAGSRSWSTDLVSSLAFLTLAPAGPRSQAEPGNESGRGELIETAPVRPALPRRPLVSSPMGRGENADGGGPALYANPPPLPCHPEGSEGSRQQAEEILRCAQDVKGVGEEVREGVPGYS